MLSPSDKISPFTFNAPLSVKSLSISIYSLLSSSISKEISAILLGPPSSISNIFSSIE